MNAAKFQGYSFYRFWDIKGKPTNQRGGVGIWFVFSLTPPPPRLGLTDLLQSSLPDAPDALSTSKRFFVISAWVFKVACFAYFLWEVNSCSGDISFSKMHFPIVFAGLDDGPWINIFWLLSKNFMVELSFSFSSLKYFISVCEWSERISYVSLSRN